MKLFRQVCAAPFFAIGAIFMGLAGLILGDQYVDWLETPRQTHH